MYVLLIHSLWSAPRDLDKVECKYQYEAHTFMWICKCGVVRKSTLWKTVSFSSIINNDTDASLKFHSLENDIQYNEGSFFFFYFLQEKFLKGFALLFKNKLHSMDFKNIFYIKYRMFHRIRITEIWRNPFTSSDKTSLIPVPGVRFHRGSGQAMSLTDPALILAVWIQASYVTLSHVPLLTCKMNAIMSTSYGLLWELDKHASIWGPPQSS